MKVSIRWLIRRDFPAVLNIEQLGNPPYWTEEDFLNALRRKNCIGMVATKPCDDGTAEPLGFMVYELDKGSLTIVNFAVHPAFRRKGIGRAMVNRLIDKLNQQRRHSFFVRTRESNLVAQRFFSACGLRAEWVDRGHFEDTGEDAYLFAYRIDEHAMA
ncbi:MAG: GNAT family N-acetyltransferase [Planctomycetaceae bacterium]|nr:GNAT family N-acetyltransferase [Planctomycetaceae bacterium]